MAKKKAPKRRASKADGALAIGPLDWRDMAVTRARELQSVIEQTIRQLEDLDLDDDDARAEAEWIEALYCEGYLGHEANRVALVALMYAVEIGAKRRTEGDPWACAAALDALIRWPEIRAQLRDDLALAIAIDAWPNAGRPPAGRLSRLEAFRLLAACVGLSPPAIPALKNYLSEHRRRLREREA